MLGLNDFVAMDNATFLNPDEFGKVYNIDGKEITAVSDRDIFQTSRMAEHTGAYVAIEHLYVFVSDFPTRPRVTQRMHIDGVLYLVHDCKEVMGIYDLTLEVLAI